MKKEKMGTYQSSLNCERLALIFQGCFGRKRSTKQYQHGSDANSQAANSSSYTGNEGDTGSTNEAFVGTSHVKRKSARKNSCPRETCCTKVSLSDSDDFPYNICSPATDLQKSFSSVEKSSCTCSSDLKQVTVVPTKHTDGELNEQKYAELNSVHQEKLNLKPKATDVVVKLYGSDTRTLVSAHQSGVSEESSSDAVKTLKNVKDFPPTETVCIELLQNRNCENRIDSTLNNRLDYITGVQSTDETFTSQSNVPLATKVEESATSILKDSVKDAHYFRNLLSEETKKLSLLIEQWNKTLEDTDCPAEVCDEIRTVVGQSRLVIVERFYQFLTLIDQAEGKSEPTTKDRPVLLSDLQGFWDMIYFQVEDVNRKFEVLQKVKVNGWNEQTAVPNKAKPVEVQTKKSQRKREPRKQQTKKHNAGEEDRKRREAARKRLAEARKAFARRSQSQQENVSQPNLDQDADLVKPGFVVLAGESSAKGDDVIEEVKLRPETVVDAVSCAVSVGSASSDQTALSNMSSSNLVH